MGQRSAEGQQNQGSRIIPRRCGGDFAENNCIFHLVRKGGQVFETPL